MTGVVSENVFVLCSKSLLNINTLRTHSDVTAPRLRRADG